MDEQSIPGHDSQKRSIQDIIPPARSKPLRPPPTMTQTPLPPPRDPGLMLKSGDKNKKYFFIIVVIVVLAVVGAGIAIMSTVFHRAYVTVTPYTFSVDVEDTFASATDSATLPYERVSVEETASKNAPATGSRQVEDRASGTLTVYNAYSTNSQRLITNTRFESPNGLIYRVHSAIVIPGYTMKAGLKVPGSLDVTVYADEPGEKYNIGLVDFTVPGLKGSDQFTLIYAKSKTPMSGGFVGTRATVDPSVRAEAVAALRADLERTLRAKIAETRADSKIIFDDSVSIVYAESPDRIEGGEAVISVSGTAIAPAFSKESLAREIADKNGIQFTGALTVSDPQSLSAVIDSPAKAAAGEALSLTVSGTVVLTAVLDESALMSALQGKTEEDLTSIRANAPAIERMQVKIYPFWRNSVPADAGKIRLETGASDDADS